jgi:uncharacterized protein (DUF488 family)
MLFTLGTSNRTLSEFIFELQRRKITHLVDVRSNPYSRYAWFNARRIELWSERSGMMYRQEGEVLGGLSEVPVDDTRYLAALNTLRDQATKEHVAIFCSEGAPELCHRTYRIGAALMRELDFQLLSILRNGEEEDIRETLKRVPGSRFSGEIERVQPNLFRWIS